jgi:colicin import membrane protein
MRMTRTRWLTVVGAGIAGLLAVAPAEARAGGSSTSEVSGTVDAVDPTSHELTLAGSDETLTVTDETQIVKDGARAALSDVKEGDEVRASYSESGDVTSLEIVGEPFTDAG